MGLISYIKSMFSKNEKLEKLKQGVELKKFPETLSVVPTRTRNKKGHFVKDDKSTVSVNEAWVGGKSPKKKVSKKKVSKKKKVTKKK